MENQCRHNSFRQVSKIIPRSLQTPAALKEEQYERFFKHKIFKHSPGVCSTSDSGSEPSAPCTGWLHTPALCSNLRLNHSCWILRCSRKATQTERLRLQTDRRTKRIYCSLNGTSLSSLSIRLIRVYAIYWSLRWKDPPQTPRPHIGHWLLTLFTANHMKAPLCTPQRINSNSASWPL